MANGFGITYTVVDRAFLSYSTCVPNSQTGSDWMTDFWQCLEDGQTVSTAVSMADAAIPPMWIYTIYVDPATKVHWVYGGNPEAWTR